MSMHFRSTVTSLVVAGALTVFPGAAGASPAASTTSPLDPPDALNPGTLKQPDALNQPNTIDQPDTLGAARTHEAADVGAWLPGVLTTATDRDWFRFRMHSAGTMLLTLGDLPADYRLRLYSHDGRQLAVSDRGGREFEQLAPGLARGEYFVEVSSSRGAVDPRRGYRLLLRRLPSRLVVLDAHRVPAESLLIVTGQLLNNSRFWFQHPRVTARFFDASGCFLGEYTALAEQSTLAPGARGAFRIVAPPAAGAVRYVLRVSSQRIPAPVRPSLAAAADVPFALEGGQVRHVGRVRNSGPATAAPVHVHVLRYNRIGMLVDFGHAVLPRVATGAPSRYEIDLPGYSYLSATRVTLSQ